MSHGPNLRPEIKRIAAAIQTERDLIAATQQPLTDDWMRVRHIWMNTASEERVRESWVLLLNAVGQVEKALHYCDVATRQLGDYEKDL